MRQGQIRIDGDIRAKRFSCSLSIFCHVINTNFHGILKEVFLSLPKTSAHIDVYLPKF